MDGHGVPTTGAPVPKTRTHYGTLHAHVQGPQAPSGGQKMVFLLDFRRKSAKMADLRPGERPFLAFGQKLTKNRLKTVFSDISGRNPVSGTGVLTILADFSGFLDHFLTRFLDHFLTRFWTIF